ETDRRYIEEAIEAAKERRPELDDDLFEFLRDLLLLRVTGELETELVTRFQQLTGPVMAKGVEDTTFYNYLSLTSLNEVGGDPGKFALDAREFHEACQRMQREWPNSMLAGSTHDTKRGEDVRARISLLSEIPHQWDAAVWRFRDMCEAHWHGAEPD